MISLISLKAGKTDSIGGRLLGLLPFDLLKPQPDKLHGGFGTGLVAVLKTEVLNRFKHFPSDGNGVSCSVGRHRYHLCEKYTRVNRFCKDAGNPDFS